MTDRDIDALCMQYLDAIAADDLDALAESGHSPANAKADWSGKRIRTDSGSGRKKVEID